VATVGKNPLTTSGRDRQVVEGDDPLEAGAGAGVEAAGLSAAGVFVEESDPPEPSEPPEPESLEAAAGVDDSLGTVAELPPDRLSVL
jgi:hypothetical protein